MNGWESYWLCMRGRYRLIGPATCLLTNREYAVLANVESGEMVIVSPAQALSLGLKIVEDSAPAALIPPPPEPAPTERDWSEHKAWCERTAKERGEVMLLLPHSENADDRPSDRGNLPYIRAEVDADSWERANAIHRGEVKT